MPRDLPCVYRAGSLGEADIVAAWLEEKSIPAFVKDAAAAQGLATPFIAAPKGIEVCVAPDRADEARSLLSRHRAELRQGKSASNADAPITAVCEDCSKASTFPASQARTVQTCPWCKAYIDVPAARRN
ncbi:MAG: DUF2007 domain-containing protein [Planctomycetes bacterium]|nr:DUF2007 domain-containing protein [Planctomycetota bacterium]